jgi:nitronate monooxygenase
MDVLSRLTEPIVQGPLAGGASAPELAAAVGAASGLGFFAAGYKAPRAIREDFRALRELLDAPFGLRSGCG